MHCLHARCCARWPSCAVRGPSSIAPGRRQNPHLLLGLNSTFIEGRSNAAAIFTTVRCFSQVTSHNTHHNAVHVCLPDQHKLARQRHLCGPCRHACIPHPCHGPAGQDQEEPRQFAVRPVDGQFSNTTSTSVHTCHAQCIATMPFNARAEHSTHKLIDSLKTPRLRWLSWPALTAQLGLTGM